MPDIPKEEKTKEEKTTKQRKESDGGHESKPHKNKKKRWLLIRMLKYSLVSLKYF